MGRRSLWPLVVLASLVAGSLWVPVRAEAASTPVVVVANARSLYEYSTRCGSGWYDNPLCEERVQLRAVEGVGGTALLTAAWGYGTKTIDLSCMSFTAAEDYPWGIEGRVPYTLRASGTAEDGTTYYFVAVDGGVFGDGGVNWYDDFTMTTAPGDRECGTPRGWGGSFAADVVTA